MANEAGEQFFQLEEEETNSLYKIGQLALVTPRIGHEIGHLTTKSFQLLSGY